MDARSDLSSLLPSPNLPVFSVLSRSSASGPADVTVPFRRRSPSPLTPFQGQTPLRHDARMDSGGSGLCEAMNGEMLWFGRKLELGLHICLSGFVKVCLKIVCVSRAAA